MSENDIYRYSRKLNILPEPRCVCFYNGTEDQPEEKILKLSDAFGAKNSDIEVRVKMLNINYGRNKILMDACKPLYEYAWFNEGDRRNVFNRIR